MTPTFAPQLSQRWANWINEWNSKCFALQQRWYKLKGKPDKAEHSKKAEKERGEIEIKTELLVKPKAGSMLSLSMKNSKDTSMSLKNLKHSLGDRLKALKPTNSKKSTAKFGGENQLAEQSNRMNGSSKLDFLDGEDMSSIASSYSSINGPTLVRAGDPKVNVMSRFNPGRSSFISKSSSRNDSFSFNDNNLVEEEHDVAAAAANEENVHHHHTNGIANTNANNNNGGSFGDEVAAPSPVFRHRQNSLRFGANNLNRRSSKSSASSNPPPQQPPIRESFDSLGAGGDEPSTPPPPRTTTSNVSHSPSTPRAKEIHIAPLPPFANSPSHPPPPTRLSPFHDDNNNNNSQSFNNPSPSHAMPNSRNRRRGNVSAPPVDPIDLAAVNARAEAEERAALAASIAAASAAAAIAVAKESASKQTSKSSSASTRPYSTTTTATSNSHSHSQHDSNSSNDDQSNTNNDMDGDDDDAAAGMDDMDNYFAKYNSNSNKSSVDMTSLTSFGAGLGDLRKTSLTRQETVVSSPPPPPPPPTRDVEKSRNVSMDDRLSPALSPAATLTLSSSNSSSSKTPASDNLFDPFSTSIVSATAATTQNAFDSNFDDIINSSIRSSTRRTPVTLSDSMVNNQAAPPPSAAMAVVANSKPIVEEDEGDHIDWASSDDDEIVQKEIETFERNQVERKHLCAYYFVVVLLQFPPSHICTHTHTHTCTEKKTNTNATKTV